jgi:hypothetical protein
MSTAVVMMDTFLILFPLFLLLVGWLLKRHHSKYPNTFCGYHVGKVASKSERAWNEANLHCGMLFLRTGSAALLLNLGFAFLLTFSVGDQFEKSDAWGLAAVLMLMLSICVPTLLSILLTERHLKKKFNANGFPKEN